MKLSIVVPVYNLEKYIEASIQSLLRINMPYDYEIIIINDGSTDDSERIIQKYVDADCRIHLTTIENGGVSIARNIGIEKAKGEYIAFVDGDDVVDKNFLLWAINEADKNKYDMVQGNYYSVENGIMMSPNCQNKEFLISDYQQMVDALLGENKIIYNAVWGKIYRKKCIDDIRFDKMIQIAEDQKFLFDLFRKVKTIFISDRIAYYYTQRESSAMHRLDVSSEHDKLAVWSYCKNNISDEKIKKNIEFNELRVWVSLYAIMVRQNADKDKIDEAYGEIRKYKSNIIWRKLSNREKIKYYLIYNFRFLHDFLIKKGHKE